MTDETQEVLRFPHPEPPPEGGAIEIAPGILWIRLPLPMRLDHVNVYALDDGDGWTIVDSGFHSRRGVAIWQALQAGPLSGNPITRVVLTHHHPDHVGMAGWFRENLGAEVWATRTAWLFARMLTLDVQEEHSPESIAFRIAAGVTGEALEAWMAERPWNFADVVHPIPVGFRRIAQGDVLTMGGRDWRVEIGHGHAPEHATFWSCDGDLVITGDQVLPGISPNLGVYPTEPEADPVGEWMDACRRLKPFASDRHLVLPGHKLPFTGLPVRLDQLLDNHVGALARLEAHLHQPRRAVECFLPLFKREIGAGEFGFALVEACAHLNHLLRIGRVTRSRDAEGAWLWRIA